MLQTALCKLRLQIGCNRHQYSPSPIIIFEPLPLLLANCFSPSSVKVFFFIGCFFRWGYGVLALLFEVVIPLSRFYFDSRVSFDFSFNAAFVVRSSREHKSSKPWSPSYLCLLLDLS
ncbi:hypothetical protein AMTRI_Chr02g262070 [Amborella trichopoda]